MYVRFSLTKVPYRTSTGMTVLVLGTRTRKEKHSFGGLFEDGIVGKIFFKFSMIMTVTFHDYPTVGHNTILF
jgi:hypothetical protein